MTGGESGLRIAPYSRSGELIEAVLGDGRARAQVRRPTEIAVVLGPAGKPEVELNTAACIEDCIPIYRRRGGGCAVLLDPGNVIVSLAYPAEGVGAITRHFDRVTQWLIGGLERAGVTGVHREGTSDLVIGDRKIGGGCMYRPKGLVLYATTLLADPDIEKVERCIKHPPREPEYRRGRAHREFMGSLRRMSAARDVEAFADALRAVLDPGDL
jgi:lipoate-protein ligase A